MIKFCLLIHTAPPGGCGGVDVILTRATTITIAWDKPEIIGREDYYYTVYSRQLLALSGNTTSYVNASDRVEYTVTDLQPSTEYLFRVIVHNGVSDQVVGNEVSRSCHVVASTTDVGGCGMYRLNVLSFPSD